MDRRLFNTIVTDAASITGAPLVELHVRRDLVETYPVDSSSLVPAAVAGAALARGNGVRRRFVEAWSELQPGPAPASRSPSSGSVSESLVELLGMLPRAPVGARSLSVRLAARDELLGALRFVTDGAPDREILRAARVLAHQASLHLENLLLRRRLTRRESHYRALLENAAEAIFLVDPQTGRILRANRRAAESTGARADDLVGADLTRFISHPKTPRAQLLMRLLTSPAGRDESYSLVTAGGAMLPVSISASSVGSGESRVLQLIAKDVSNERRARDAIDHARETLSALALAGTHMMEETDETSILQVIARELGKLGFESAVLLRNDLTGFLNVAHISYSPSLVGVGEKLTGIPISDLSIDPARLPPMNQALISRRTVYYDRPTELMRAMFPNVGPRGIEDLVKNFALRHMLFAPLRIQGQIDGLLVVLSGSVRAGDVEAIDNFALQASIALERARLWQRLSDHSHKLEREVERRTRELTLAVRALKEADRRKDNFLANISHELRTPLVTILGYNQLLLSEKVGALSAQQRDCLEVARNSGKRLRAFIEELLDFSRFELTREAMRVEAFDIGAAIAEAAKSLAPRMAERSVRLETRIHPKTPHIWADRRRVMQVLENLIINAERHSPGDGRGRVSIGAARIPGGRVGVSVSDNGTGIAPEHLPRIFDRLYQVGDTRAPREGGGLGLGLNIVKSIVEAHGGSVRVRSEPGRGAKFTVLLPSVEVLHVSGRIPPPFPDFDTPF
jgi:PAS domain S-box-containing protein